MCYFILIRISKRSAVYLGFNLKLFLKIDTQGYEWQVLIGGNKTIQSAIGVMLEVSLVELYSGQKLWREILEYMHNLGFELWSISPEFIDPNSGQVLQIDTIFINKAYK